MAYNRWLAHHGVKGQKWGERNGPPYPLDSSISNGHKLIKSDGSPQSKKRYKTSEKTAHKRATRKVKTIFVSGSSKTQDESSGYYRKELPKDIQKQLDDHMRRGNRIIVGDAPGIDRQVQDYLNSKKYRNVEVYGPGKEVRYTANSNWKTNPIDDPDHEPGSKEWLAKKDIAMTEAADEGLAIVLDEGAKATRKNVQRLSESGKGVRVYSLNKDGNDSWEDDWDRKWNASYASKDVKKANDIYKTLSKQEKYFLTAEENSKRYVSKEEYGKKGTNAYSLIEQYKDTPVSVIDIWKNDRGGADVSIAVRNDSKYRHKGYASRALENGLKYFYDHPEIEYLIWGVNSQNRPSIELAKKYGFYLYDKRDDGWETYTLDQKKEIKHAMAYNRWLSQDYLAHHGVKGQKWGERNGPPYPLDSSKSDGHKLLKGDGSPQVKKKIRTSDKTAHKRAERKARTVKEESPEKAAKMQSAKNEDKWELDFLEYIQNEEWADSTSPKFNKKRMLKEYSEYLDDRYKYSQKRLSDETKIAGMQREAKAMLPKDASLSAKMRKASLFNRDGTLNAKGQKYYNVSGDGTLSFEELELRKASSSKRGLEDDDFQKYITKSEGLDTSMLSKANKAKKEKQLLELWYKDNLTDRENETVGALHRRIAHKSGSWYFGESVTEKFQKALTKERAARKAFMDNGRNEKTVRELDMARRNLCKAVLMDLGYEVNAENIQLIEGWIIDD